MAGEAQGFQEHITVPVAVTTSVALAVLYVLILYAPTVILRLPPPSSFTNFMIRRFACASVSTAVSLVVTSFILPIKNMEASYLLGVYGIRTDHFWEAVVYPLSLTSFVYSGYMVSKLLSLLKSRREDCIRSFFQAIPSLMLSAASDVSFWRNLVVAPVTEELVFRACMIPLLLCAGIRISFVILLCPILFSLAHLNHFMELYIRHNRSLLKASLIVGMQLGYTVVFGSYASFLFIRTGHLTAPLVAHIFCNYMGLPLLASGGKGAVSGTAFVAGGVAFVMLVLPLTEPGLYNDSGHGCHCWHGVCSWD